MAKTNDFDDTTYCPESVKVCAGNVGFARLSDEIAEYLSKEVTFTLKDIIQDAAKYMNHGNRFKLSDDDIGYALKQMNVENLYGYRASESLPLRYASSSNREEHFLEKKENDLNDLAIDSKNSDTKIPPEVTLRAECLAVNNPPPELLTLSIPYQKFKNKETVQIKPRMEHELSVEQQLYYENLTDACMGMNQNRRNEALQSLAIDPDIYKMLPFLSTFIKEGVRYHIVGNHLQQLIYLVQMVRALLKNETISLEKYLHELIPSVISCIVAKQLCAKPEIDNHWALRNYAAQLLAEICKKFNSSTNNIQNRITHLFSERAFNKNEELPLTSLYGTLKGLSELGPEVITHFIIPKLKFISARIESHLKGSMALRLDRLEAFNIKTLLIKVLPQVLKHDKDIPYIFEDFKNEYGYLGPDLFVAVLKAASQQAVTVTKNSRDSTGRAVVVSQQTATSTRSRVMNPPYRASSSAKNPKDVGFSPRSQLQPSPRLTFPARVLTIRSILKPKIENLQQKLAVDGVPNSRSISNTAAISTQEPTQTANINLEK